MTFSDESHLTKPEVGNWRGGRVGTEAVVLECQQGLTQLTGEYLKDEGYFLGLPKMANMIDGWGFVERKQ